MSSSHNEPEKGDQPRAEQLRARRMLSSEAPQISRRVNDENSNSNPKRRKIENPAGRQAHPAPPAHMYSADNRHSPTPLEVESPMRHRSPLAESNHRSQNRPSSSRNGPVFDDSASEASPEPATPPRILPQRPNIFPHFRDGDTLIVSPTGKQWKLHSIVLSKASPVLANILKRTNPEHITKRQQEEGRTVKWKLNMVREHSASDIDPEGLRFKAFKAVGVDSKQLPHMVNLNGLGAAAEFNRVYDNLFRCVYNMDPKFTNDDDAQARALILDATGLLQAATFLDAIPTVRLVVEANLLRLSQVLWTHIGDKPEGWIHIAARLRSPIIFRECMVHIVGKFHLEGEVNEEFLRRKAHGPDAEKIWRLIVLKTKELMDKKIRVERSLLQFYPARMLHKEDAVSIPGRAIYATDIYLWQALTIFRQYIGSAIMSNLHHRASDGGLAFYRTLAYAEATYLKSDSLEKFHQSFDMSAKGRACLVAALEQIKADAKPIVQELLADRSSLTRGVDDLPLDHLTSTEICEEEMPWWEKPAEVVDYGDDLGY